MRGVDDTQWSGDPAAYFGSVAATHSRCFWLDGAGGRDWSGRRSLVGWLAEDDVSLTYDAASGVVTRRCAGRSVAVGAHRSDVFGALEAELAAGGPEDVWVGYFGYACRPDLPATAGGALPDAVWMRAREVRSFEHPGAAGESREPVAVAGGGGPVEASTATVPAAYSAAFDEVQERLHAGDSYEVNLTYRLERRSDLNPVSAYLRLRELNPAPYAGFLQHDVPGARAWLLSSSPERYATVTADRTLETRPIKGTAPRGRTVAEDAAQRDHLARDPKCRAENLMIVDLMRNDLSMVCEVGSVQVPALMQVESYASVHQLVSTVRGRLRDEVTTMGALRALFPAGSMTGAPKLRTMEVIRDLEHGPRGVYAGAFGWVRADGSADLGVVIRSLMTCGDERWWLGTGGGITVRSRAAEEHAESVWKADRLLRVLSPLG